jgi:hypothetical protein
MPRVAFDPQLHRFLDAPPHRVEGATVRAAFDAVFAGNPAGLWTPHHCGLFRSSDGGDSGQTISTNLPPIYAMRFGTAHS